MLGPFDHIVIGGGSFGAVIATRLFNLDRTHRHRVLVLEAGPLALPEHVQNLPPSFAPSGKGSPGTIWGQYRGFYYRPLGEISPEAASVLRNVIAQDGFDADKHLSGVTVMTIVSGKVTQR